MGVGLKGILGLRTQSLGVSDGVGRGDGVSVGQFGI